MATLDFHELAEIFPLIEGAEFDALVADMREHGQREKIVLVDGKILDGRNRYRAAVAGDLPAAHGDADCYRDFNPSLDGDLVAFVLSKNLTRRHLDESQRAMAAARLANLPAHRPSEKSANLLTSQNDAAKRLNVSLRLVTAAKAVQDGASARLQQLVDQGKLAVTQACKAARLAMTIQDQIADMAAAGKANAVRTAIKKSERSTREENLGRKIQALPDAVFGIILADPEWEHVAFSQVTGMDRSPANHYPTSTEQEISNRDVQKISAKDCMLALWTTDLARGIRVMEAWGFIFKSYLVWAKDIVEGPRNADGKRTWVEVGGAGNGYWFRDRDELLLIGTRGNFVAPAMGTQPESVLFAARPKVEGTQRGRHSAKPEGVHLWIELNWPNTPKIELNARQARDGWASWGNEAPTIECVGVLGEKLAQAIAEKAAGIEERKAAEGSDDLYARAIDLVRADKKASTSYLQRKLAIGYNRAAALMERMEVAGIITAPDHRGVRAIIDAAPAMSETQQNTALNETSNSAAEFDGVNDLPPCLKRT
jgi:N6-adenosine-specific RNA methylase IME4